MSYVDPTTPNAADYTTFLQTELQIPAAALPANSPWITYALNRSIDMTLQVPTVAAEDYVNTVYCGAAHIQLSITPDQPGQDYFSTAQGASGFALSGATSGVVSSASDQGTSSSFAVPSAMSRLTFQDLQFSKTPWGRAWLSWGQDFGPAWGVS